MEKVIADQVQHGIFISAHLQAGAIDVRTRDLPEDVKDALWYQVIVNTPAVDEGMEETKPPHYHLQVVKPWDRILCALLLSRGPRFQVCFVDPGKP